MSVIILNGASSAGKSSIARELQTILPEPYLHIGIDTFIAMMPKKVNELERSDCVMDGFYFKSKIVNGVTVPRIHCGHYAKRINQVYHSTVKHLADSGMNVIVDDIMDGVREQRQWKAALGDISLLFVGVHCSLPILAEREKSRHDRLQGAAMEQAKRVHEGIKYDLEVSSTDQTARDSAQVIAQHINRRTIKMDC